MGTLLGVEREGGFVPVPLSVDLVERWGATRWRVVSSPAFNGSLDVVYGASADASNDVRPWATVLAD